MDELGLGSEEDIKNLKELIRNSKPKKKDKDDKPDDEIIQRNQFLEGENSKILKQVRDSKIENAVILAMTDAPWKFYNKDAKTMFMKMITEKLGFDKKDELCVIGENGTALLNEKGQRLTITELMGNTIKDHGYLLESGVKPGAGSPPSGQTPVGGKQQPENKTSRDSLKGKLGGMQQVTK